MEWGRAENGAARGTERQGWGGNGVEWGREEYRAGVLRERLGLGDSGVEENECGWIRVRWEERWNGEEVGVGWSGME